MHVATHHPANLTTGQFAAAIGRSSQTIRSHHCRTGEAFGIRPRKIGRLLLWPADKVAALLDGSDKLERRPSAATNFKQEKGPPLAATLTEAAEQWGKDHENI